MEQAKSIQLQQGECRSSYDVKALNIICSKLQHDTTLHSRTPLSTHNMMSLVEFFLKSTFSTFQGKYYEWVQGAAMGPPLSTVVANLFMEGFKTRALNSSPKPQGYGSGLWMTHSISTKQNIHNNSYPTLTPLTPTYSSQPNPQTNMPLFPSWTP